MYQGAVLGLRRGHFQRVPASRCWLWAHLEGGSLASQLPHHAWALLPHRGTLSSSRRKAGANGGGSKVTANPAAFISNLPKPEF